MDKYIILSPEAKGTFNDRLNFLYLKLGNYLDTEKLENRTLQYCKVFLSDAQNQTQNLEESLLYQEYLKDTHLTVVEQPPLNGNKFKRILKYYKEFGKDALKEAEKDKDFIVSHLDEDGYKNLLKYL